jgi:hypothetical protein
MRTAMPVTAGVMLVAARWATARWAPEAACPNVSRDAGTAACAEALPGTVIAQSAAVSEVMVIATAVLRARMFSLLDVSFADWCGPMPPGAVLMRSVSAAASVGRSLDRPGVLASQGSGVHSTEPLPHPCASMLEFRWDVVGGQSPLP